jgi:hypothetical protein
MGLDAASALGFMLPNMLSSWLYRAFSGLSTLSRFQAARFTCMKKDVCYLLKLKIGEKADHNSGGLLKKPKPFKMSIAPRNQQKSALILRQIRSEKGHMGLDGSREMVYADLNWV